MEENEFAIICRRVSEVPDPKMNSERDHCPVCKEEIWVSPRSRVRQRDLGAKLFCAHCAVEKFSDKPHMVIGKPGQFEVLNKDVGGSGMYVPLGEFKEDPDEVMKKMKEKNDYGPNSKN